VPRLFKAALHCGAVVGLMAVPTWLLFGSTGGFHHMIGFRPFPFFYMVWHGEDPVGGFQIVQGYDVWLDPLRLAVLVVVWLAILAAVLFFVHVIRAAFGPDGIAKDNADSDAMPSV